MRKLVILLLLLAVPVVAQDTASIDKAVGEILAKTGAPSASVAVVEGFQKGEIDRALFTSNANAYFSDHSSRSPRRSDPGR